MAVFTKCIVLLLYFGLLRPCRSSNRTWRVSELAREACRVVPNIYILHNESIIGSYRKQVNIARFMIKDKLHKIIRTARSLYLFSKLLRVFKLLKNG